MILHVVTICDSAVTICDSAVPHRFWKRHLKNGTVPFLKMVQQIGPWSITYSGSSCSPSHARFWIPILTQWRWWLCPDASQQQQPGMIFIAHLDHAHSFLPFKPLDTLPEVQRVQPDTQVGEQVCFRWSSWFFCRLPLQSLTMYWGTTMKRMVSPAFPTLNCSSCWVK